MRSQSRGIVLISILVLTLIATFFIGALIQMNPTRLRRTVHDENRDRAVMAARAGVDYALNRFKADVDWKADANAVVVDMPELVIREDRGNVLGWIKAEDGSWAGFRFRFNYQDGFPVGTEPYTDEYDQNPQYPIASPEISLNNLLDANGKAAYLGDGPTNNPTGTPGIMVPGNALGLIVEGIVSPDLDPEKPGTLANAPTAVKRTMEGLYVIADVSSGIDSDAVAMAGADANYTLGTGVLSLESNDDNIARMRSKGETTLVRGSGAAGALIDPDADAAVLVGEGSTFSALSTSGTTFVGGEEQATSPFPELTWDKIGLSDQVTPINIPSGVYAFSNGDADSGRSVTAGDLKYYNMSWEQYRAAKIAGTLPAPEPVSTEFANRVEFDSKDYVEADGTISKRDVIRFDRDVNVTGGGELVIIPERGARQMAGEDGTAGDSVDPAAPIPNAPNVTVAKEGLKNGLFSKIGGKLGVGVNVQPKMPHFAAPIQMEATGDVFLGQSPTAVQGLYNLIAGGGGSFEIGGLPSKAATLQAAKIPGASFSHNGTNIVVTISSPAQALNYTGPPQDPATPGTDDPLHIPNVDADGKPIPDKTVPQDIEIVFEPGDDAGSAFIRSDGNIFLGTHVTGKGGGVVAKGKLDMIGLGVDIQAKAANSDRDGIALYGQTGVNISTFDERRNKYWDVQLKGAVFTRNNLDVRLGEEPLGNGKPDPTWGVFDYEGSIIALGKAPGEPVDFGTPESFFGDSSDSGFVNIMAQGIRLFYDPRYLTPYLGDEQINPTFAPLSVVER